MMVDGSQEPLGVHVSPVVAAAHELKSPLALVRQLALALEVGADIEEREKFLRQIVLTSERALRLTSDLTRSVRLQDSMFELEPVNPQQICEEVAHELTPLYAARRRCMRVTCGVRQTPVVANRELLRRVITNFADNALNYSLSDEPVIMSTNRTLGGSRVRIGVRDFGPSISPAAWKRMKRALGMGAQPLHARPQSSGLGLYICGQLAKAMHATVGSTRHSNGATFYIELDASTQLRLL